MHFLIDFVKVIINNWCHMIYSIWFINSTWLKYAFCSLLFLVNMFSANLLSCRYNGAGIMLFTSGPVNCSNQRDLWKVWWCARAWMPFLAMDFWPTNCWIFIITCPTAWRSLWNKDEGWWHDLHLLWMLVMHFFCLCPLKVKKLKFRVKIHTMIKMQWLWG